MDWMDTINSIRNSLSCDNNNNINNNCSNSKNDETYSNNYNNNNMITIINNIKAFLFQIKSKYFSTNYNEMVFVSNNNIYFISYSKTNTNDNYNFEGKKYFRVCIDYNNNKVLISPLTTTMLTEYNSLIEKDNNNNNNNEENNNFFIDEYEDYNNNKSNVLKDFNNNIEIIKNKNWSKKISFNNNCNNNIILLLNRLQKIINGIMCKIPKIVLFYSNGNYCKDNKNNKNYNTSCKCMLMLNDPLPDFNIQWRNNTRLKY
jgi:hypothetical protein